MTVMMVNFTLGLLSANLMPCNFADSRETITIMHCPESYTFHCPSTSLGIVTQCFFSWGADSHCTPGISIISVNIGCICQTIFSSTDLTEVFFYDFRSFSDHVDPMLYSFTFTFFRLSFFSFFSNSFLLLPVSVSFLSLCF